MQAKNESFSKDFHNLFWKLKAAFHMQNWLSLFIFDLMHLQF